MEIRALRPTDERATFESGDEALVRFLHRYAGQNQFRHHLGVTYVAVEGGRVLGYATVAPRHLEIEELPARVRKRLPRYPLPVLGLARLAVDRSARSIGLGRELLRFVLDLASKMADEVGCAGVVVDAKPGAFDLYAKYGFTPFDVLEGESEARPRPTTMCCPCRQSSARADRPARDGSWRELAVERPSASARRWRESRARAGTSRESAVFFRSPDALLGAWSEERSHGRRHEDGGCRTRV
jgi:predicted N-acetyltransferase YhbS